MKILYVILLLLLSYSTAFVARRPLDIRCSQLHMSSNAYQPLVYKSVRMIMPDKTERTLIYRLSQIKEHKTAFEAINKMIRSEWVDPVIIDDLVKQGLVMSFVRPRSYKTYKPVNYVPVLKPEPLLIESDVGCTLMYVNCGTKEKPLYVKKYTAAAMKENLADGSMSADEIIEQGLGFSDGTDLIEKENSRREKLKHVERIKHLHPGTEEWRRFTNYTWSHNASSLREIMQMYSASHSAFNDGEPPDIQDTIPGFIGTFPSSRESAEWRKKPVKFPLNWPDFQMHPWHVRWPVNTPLNPGVNLFLALNDKYEANFKNELLSMPYREVYGDPGTMVPFDALKIAKMWPFGKCYEPSEQVAHGGLAFDMGFNLPFYQTAHGPTANFSREIPESIAKILDKFPSPFPKEEKSFLTSQLLSEVQQEEIARQKALRAMGLADVNLDKEKTLIEIEVDKILATRRLRQQKQSEEDNLEDAEREARRQREFVRNRVIRQQSVSDLLGSVDGVRENAPTFDNTEDYAALKREFSWRMKSYYKRLRLRNVEKLKPIQYRKGYKLAYPSFPPDPLQVTRIKKGLLQDKNINRFSPNSRNYRDIDEALAADAEHMELSENPEFTMLPAKDVGKEESDHDH